MSPGGDAHGHVLLAAWRPSVCTDTHTYPMCVCFPVLYNPRIPPEKGARPLPSPLSPSLPRPPVSLNHASAALRGVCGFTSFGFLEFLVSVLVSYLAEHAATACSETLAGLALSAPSWRPRSSFRLHSRGSSLLEPRCGLVQAPLIDGRERLVCLRDACGFPDSAPRAKAVSGEASPLRCLPIWTGLSCPSLRGVGWSPSL